MSWLELFETFVNGLLASTNVTGNFFLEVAKVLDPTLKMSIERVS